MKKRKPIIPRQTNHCKGSHKGPFKMEKTALGTKRTCVCGGSITEIGRNIDIKPVNRLYLVKSKGRVQ